MRCASAPGWLVAGGLVTTLVALAGGSAGAGGEKDVRLLVSCDGATRPAVLSALASLDVVVHDLATMKRVPLGPPAGIPEAARIAEAFYAEIERSSAAGGPGVEARAISVTDRTATVRVRAPMESLAGLEEALARNPLLLAESPRRGAVRAEGGRVEGEMVFRLAPPSEPATVPPGVFLIPLAEIQEAATAAGVRLVSTSPQTVDVRDSDEVRSMDFECTASDLAAVRSLLRETARVAGLRVSGFEWKAPDDDGGRHRVRLRVSLRRAR